MFYYFLDIIFQIKKSVNYTSLTNLCASPLFLEQEPFALIEFSSSLFGLALYINTFFNHSLNQVSTHLIMCVWYSDCFIDLSQSFLPLEEIWRNRPQSAFLHLDTTLRKILTSNDVINECCSDHQCVRRVGKKWTPSIAL